MWIQYHRYTRWRLLEDEFLAEECLRNNAAGSYAVSFLGVMDTFFSSQKTRNGCFFSVLPSASFHDSWAVRLCSFTRWQSVPASPTLMMSQGDTEPARGRAEPLLSCPPDWVEGSSPSRAGDLPPSALRSGKGCGSSFPLFPTVGAEPFITPGQLSSAALGMISVLWKAGGFECWQQGGVRRGWSELNCSIKSALHTRKVWCKSLFWGTQWIAVTYRLCSVGKLIYGSGNHSAPTDCNLARHFITNSKVVCSLGYSLIAVILACINSNKLDFLQVWMVKLRWLISLC